MCALALNGFGVSECVNENETPSGEMMQLVHNIAHRVGHYLERQGLQERDAENSYLAVDAGAMEQLQGHAITYRIALGPQAGRKVFTQQTLPAKGTVRPVLADSVEKL